MVVLLRKKVVKPLTDTKWCANILRPKKGARRVGHKSIELKGSHSNPFTLSEFHEMETTRS